MNKLLLVLFIASLALFGCGANNEMNNADTNVNSDVELEPTISPSEQFMQDKNVSLTAKEVHYDIQNNLDNDFFIEGTLSLCDYYNYGYTNQEKFFCGFIEPTDGKYSESWYVYFHREMFDSVYNELMNSNIDAMVIARVYSDNYKDGQGNMAIVTSIRH